MNDLPLPSLEKSITHVRMKLSSRLAPRGDPRSRSCSILSILSYPRKKEDELRNETSWESIERSEKLGGWVGGWEDVDLERAAEGARSRWKVGRGNQDVRFPQIPYPKVRQKVAAFPPFPSIFPAGLRAAGLIDTFNDSGKNGE